VLPPGVQQLLNQLPSLPGGLNTQNLNNLTANAPQAVTGAQGGSTNDQSANKLLDFLLSP